MNALVNKVLRKVFPGNVAVPRAALDDLFALEALAGAATARTQSEQLTAAAALDLPVDIGDVKLWRLTMAGCEWLTQIERDWFAGDPRMMEIAVVWACAHGRDRAAFAELGGRFKTAFKLAAWARWQNVAWQALAATVKALLPKQSAPADTEPAQLDDDAGAYLGGVLGALIENFGQTADYWLWDVPQETALALLARLGARAEAEAGERVGPRQIAAHKAFAAAAKAFDAKWGAHG